MSHPPPAGGLSGPPAADAAVSSAPAKPDMRALVPFAAPKAGMTEEETARIAARIYELSKDSAYYQNQRRKDIDVDKRIDGIMKGIKSTESMWKNQHSSVIQAQERGAARKIDRMRSDLELWFRGHTAPCPPPEALKPLDLASLPRAHLLALLRDQVFASSPPAYIHIDFDSFYASVAILDNPSLAALPIAVGDAAMISTSNYIARRFGVRSAMPGFLGKALCPDLTFVRPDYPRYNALAAQYRPIFREYHAQCSTTFLDEASLNVSALVQARAARAVCDALARAGAAGPLPPPFAPPEQPAEQQAEPEPDWLAHVRSCFYTYADTANTTTEVSVNTDHSASVSPSPRVHIDWTAIASAAAAEVRARVFARTGLTCSAGIAGTRMAAKICSDRNKPNGQASVQLTAAATQQFFADLPVRKVPGFGRVTEKLLCALGYPQCGLMLTPRAVMMLGIAFSVGTALRTLRAAAGLGSTGDTDTDMDGDGVADAAGGMGDVSDEPASVSTGSTGGGSKSARARPRFAVLHLAPACVPAAATAAVPAQAGACAEVYAGVSAPRVRVRMPNDVQSQAALAPYSGTLLRAQAAGVGACARVSEVDIVFVEDAGTGTVAGPGAFNYGDDDDGDDGGDGDGDGSSSGDAHPLPVATALPPLPLLDLRTFSFHLRPLAGRKSLSTERTFRATGDAAFLRARVRDLAARLGRYALKERLAACTVTVKIKFDSFEVTQRTATFSAPAAGAASGRPAAVAGIVDGLRRLLSPEALRGSSDRSLSGNAEDDAATCPLEPAPALVAGRGHDGVSLALRRPVWAWPDLADAAAALLDEARGHPQQHQQHQHGSTSATHDSASGIAPPLAPAPAPSSSLRLLGVRLSGLYELPTALAERADRCGGGGDGGGGGGRPDGALSTAARAEWRVTESRVGAPGGGRPAAAAAAGDGLDEGFEVMADDWGGDWEADVDVDVNVDADAFADADAEAFELLDIDNEGGGSPADDGGSNGDAGAAATEVVSSPARSKRSQPSASAEPSSSSALEGERAGSGAAPAAASSVGGTPVKRPRLPLYRANPTAAVAAAATTAAATTATAAAASTPQPPAVPHPAPPVVPSPVRARLLGRAYPSPAAHARASAAASAAAEAAAVPPLVVPSAPAPDGPPLRAELVRLAGDRGVVRTQARGESGAGEGEAKPIKDRRRIRRLGVAAVYCPACGIPLCDGIGREALLAHVLRGCEDSLFRQLF